MFGLCTKKACILVGIITSLLPLLYDIRVDGAPGPHGIMYQYRARIGSNTHNFRVDPYFRTKFGAKIKQIGSPRGPSAQKSVFRKFKMADGRHFGF